VSSSSIFFSVEEFCKAENLDKSILKAVAVDSNRLTVRDLAKKHDIGSSTVQKYRNKLKALDRENYIIVMNDIFREELNRALFQKQ